MKRTKMGLSIVFLIGACLLALTPEARGRIEAYRVIKFSDAWPNEYALDIEIVVKGDEGPFEVTETPPADGQIGAATPAVSEMADGIIVWASGAETAGEIHTFGYRLTLPGLESANYRWSGMARRTAPESGGEGEIETAGPAVFDPSRLNPGVQSPVDTSGMGLQYNYLVYLPPSYYESDEKWPLLVFLHGSGESGSRLNALKVHSLPRLVEEPFTVQSLFGSFEFPFVMVSPQSPADRHHFFENRHILDVLDHAVNSSQLNIDENRIYVTGMSMGGFGSYEFAHGHPDIPAAIVPVAGAGIVEEFVAEYSAYEIHATTPGPLVDMPIWAFHGGRDPFIPVDFARDIIDRINAIGGNAKFTLFPDVGHDADPAYRTPELYQWLLGQKRPVSALPANAWQGYE